MFDEQIRIERIKVKALYEFACKAYNKAAKDDIIPIAKHRALAYANNPYAEKDDIGLLVAYMQEKCIGYLGIIPGKLRIGDAFSKIYWFSTWFVPAKLRNTGAGIFLIREALLLKYDIVVTGVSEKAERVYRGLGFREIGPLNYYIIAVDRMNFLSSAIRLLRGVLRKMGIRFKIFNTIIKLSNYIYSPVKQLFYNILLKSLKGDIRYEEVKEIHPEDISSASNNLSSTEFYRGIDAINWMLQYKCVLESHKAEPLDYNYYFSEIRDIFKYIVLKVHSSDKGDYKGFLVLSITSKNMRTVLKVLDFHFFKKIDYKYILFLALKYAKLYLADHIEFPDTLSAYIKDSALAKLLLYRKERIYFCYPKNKSSPIVTSYDNINLNYCDSDFALT